MMGNDEFDILVDPYHGYRAFQMAKARKRTTKISRSLVIPRVVETNLDSFLSQLGSVRDAWWMEILGLKTNRR